VAITDHDTTNGLEEALETKRAYPDMTLIPGVELSADSKDTEMHLLGYFLDYEDDSFQKTLSKFREGRVGRAMTMVNKLSDLGVKLKWERVLEFAGDGAVGRPHIARTMIEMGYVASMSEAFDKYLGRGMAVYAERDKFSPLDAIELIHSVNGLAVLAHPSWVDNLESQLPALVGAGLAGMEVHYSNYSSGLIAELESLANRFGLVSCGGSDYHANNDPGESLPGDQGPPQESVDRLKEIAMARIATH
jgi:predicted metal-dependent phosphoesterase TrpH